MTNRRYFGHYIYKDVDIEGGIPRIISDELFERAQNTIEKNRKAPSRSKAKEVVHIDHETVLRAL